MDYNLRHVFSMGKNCKSPLLPMSANVCQCLPMSANVYQCLSMFTNVYNGEKKLQHLTSNR